jgi:ribosome-associated protein
MNHPTDDFTAQTPSKSQLKRDSEKLQLFGRQLVEMPDNQLQKFALDENLKAAIYEARRLPSREAKRRQIQYIGKLMRTADIEHIELTLARLDNQSKTFRQHFAKLERWREQIINQGGPAIEAFIKDYPSADRQQLRNLQRQANREREQNKPPAASRKLFAYLRELAD